VRSAKAKKKAQVQNNRPDNLFNDPVEKLVKVPSDKTSAYQRLLRSRKWMSRLLLSILILFPLTLFMLMDSYATKGTALSTASLAPTEGKANLYNAQVFVQHLLASKATPVANASFLGFASVNTLGGGAEDVSCLVASHTETATLTVEMQGGNVLEGPSLNIIGGGVPGQPEGVTANSPWPTLRGVSQSPTISGPLTQALNGWANSYATGTSSQLALTVGDANALDHYTPLTGVSQMRNVVVDFGYTSPKASNGQSLLEVTMTLEMAHVKQPVQLTYDLLVERASSAAPTIVAWGPPGTGPNLVPYQNAQKLKG